VLDAGLQLDLERAPAHQAPDGIPLDGHRRDVVGGIAQQRVIEALDLADQAVAVLQAKGISLLGKDGTGHSGKQRQAEAEAPQRA
jgi:hypothetical protein